LGISKITLSSFRNHSQKELDFGDGLTVVWGENGTGKTSLLEAVYFLSFGKSFKTHKQETLVKEGYSSFFLKGVFSSTTKKGDQVNIYYKKQSTQKVLINGKKTSGRKSLIGKNPVVVLSPEEQEITKGGPSERRRFFDRVFSVCSGGYLIELQKYRKLLKQRNAALLRIKKGLGGPGDVVVWNEPLAKSGIKLWSIRTDFFEKFKNSLGFVVDSYGEDIDIEVSYPEKQKDPNVYLEELKKREQRDTVLCRTTFGPHLDDVSVLWFGKNLKFVGSQGEHKISLVFLKLAEMNFIKNYLGDFPTLLLDDLFAKLDLSRSKKLVSLLKSMKSENNKPIQTIVTTTDLLNIEKIGILSMHENTTTHQLTKQCST